MSDHPLEIRERELCKRDVCKYCGLRALGYERFPDGPNEAGNWTHQHRDSLRLEDRVLCAASAIFTREHFYERLAKAAPPIDCQPTGEMLGGDGGGV